MTVGALHFFLGIDSSIEEEMTSAVTLAVSEASEGMNMHR